MDIADRYGILIAAGLWLLYRGWSFITERYFPQYSKMKEERDRAVREADATLLKAKIEREKEESEWRRKLEERQVAAIETLSQSVSALVLSHGQHVNFTFGAHVELKDRLDDIQESINTSKRLEELEKKVIDTQDKISNFGKKDGDSKV